VRLKFFQAKIQETLLGLPGVACTADNILIYGCSDTTEEAERNHDMNMIALLERCRKRNLCLNDEKLQLK